MPIILTIAIISVMFMAFLFGVFKLCKALGMAIKGQSLVVIVAIFTTSIALFIVTAMICAMQNKTIDYSLRSYL